jgi:putative NIF3 family GTP cyclohydrolase 1 type 2
MFAGSAEICRPCVTFVKTIIRMQRSSHFPNVSRRVFVSGALTALGVSWAHKGSATAKGNISPEALTVQQVIDLILHEIPVGPIDKTVDTLKAGKPDQPVTGIVSTMFATVDVIRKAIDARANFIIAHEPTFYNHLDETEWLGQDKVYEYKRHLLDEHGIAVWRFHDYWHRHNPDGVRMGVLARLGWEKYYDAANPRMVKVPATALKEVIRHVKEKLGIREVRTIGDPSQMCERILVMPGASGGRAQIQALKEQEPDLLICGEVAEWETAEYIRDARAMGAKRSLIVLGHAQSEEPGMEWLVPWLKPKVNGIPVIHIPSDNPFTFR